MKWNIRHLRVFLAVTRHSSVSRAADECHLSQPAVTQAIAKLERAFALPLFQHMTQGLFVTPAGETLALRVERALARIDTATAPIAPRLSSTATTSQLEALIAVRELENFSLAARHLGLAQPTVHRAVSQLESEAQKPLFKRSAYGLRATRACQALADAAQLAFAELDQAVMELAELAGREVGQIVVGALPLSRAYILSSAIIEFRKTRPNLLIRVDEGPYSELLSGLRRGEVDMLIGALRDPVPIDDVTQTELFTDDLILVAGPDHPLVGKPAITLEEMAAFPWVVARNGTPTRMLFDKLFDPAETQVSLVETGSMILMRQLLRQSNHLGCISRLQAAAEVDMGLMVPLDFDLTLTRRPIGLTTRVGWIPTRGQLALIDKISQAAAE
ncbi:LysR family transcriptional regulator [Actibacterium lipolyticum]|uniref:HTH-type transcriptional activator CmpR n=1 Tax=Actibacterium lipolyticum TaxID=1524263 RepID=A0A238L8C5_9RHOB|nr:LysR family transcriptional regulator [Actibacterium lipolyticum]SMX51257.1 HTH-type transcriptional activator CmpR [Actibacterium lipolyticum]